MLITLFIGLRRNECGDHALLPYTYGASNAPYEPGNPQRPTLRVQRVIAALAFKIFICLAPSA
jgi:hypothetical protein